MPESKQQQSNALHEAVLWYLRCMGKHLSTSERDELATWLRRSPENVSAFFLTRSVIRRSSPARRVLSMSYYKYVKQQSLYPKIGLNVVALCSVVSGLFLHDVRSLKIAVVAFACFLLLQAKEAVTGLRVARGYFGSTESEVRDFIKFIMARRRAIDVTAHWSAPGVNPLDQWTRYVDRALGVLFLKDPVRTSLGVVLGCALSSLVGTLADLSAMSWWHWPLLGVLIMHVPTIRQWLNRRSAGSHAIDSLFELIDRGDFSSAERQQLYRRLIERFVALAAADRMLRKK